MVESKSTSGDTRAHTSADTGPDTSPDTGDYTIGQVCERAALSARTVRYYEEVGLLPGVRRRNGGRRVYGADELERLRFIKRLKQLGLSLAEIKELNVVYAIAGSTRAMLGRLEDLLDMHVRDVEVRVVSLSDLRDELVKYRDHVRARGAALPAATRGDGAESSRREGEPK